MKNTGIERRIDELGRIVIPKELRTKLEINIGDPMEIYVNGQTIILEKYQDSCIFCSNTKNIETYNNKLLCKDCIGKISKLLNE